MTWTAVSDTTNPSWGAVSDTTNPSYVARTAVSSPAYVWGQLSAVTDQDDVDFAYQASEQFPMVVSSETARALQALTSVISEP